MPGRQQRDTALHVPLLVLAGPVLREIREARASSPGQPLMIFLGGGWGAGKSTTATQLAAELGVANVIHSDVVRAVLRECASAEQRKLLMPSTYESWQLVADRFSPEALAKGFRTQCGAMAPAIRRCLREAVDFGKDTIVEGMHLHPGIYAPTDQEGQQLFVWLVCARRHLPSRIVDRCRTTYLRRSPERYTEDARFRKITSLNTSLEAEANSSGVPVLDLSVCTDRQKLPGLFARYVDRLVSGGRSRWKEGRADECRG
jgi:2-phosphoglycerate kinase